MHVCGKVPKTNAVPNYLGESFLIVVDAFGNGGGKMLTPEPVKEVLAYTDVLGKNLEK